MVHSKSLKNIVKAHPDFAKSHKPKKSNPVDSGGGIAQGFTPQPKLDLKYMGGKTIQNLTFQNFYLGAASGWASSDITNIDTNLGGAMTDPNLNAIYSQYYNGGLVTTTMVPSKNYPYAVPATFDRDTVDLVLTDMLTNGALTGLNFDSTVVNLMLPEGIILTTDTTKGGEKKAGDKDDSDSSLQGLGGYHGSSHVTDATGNAVRIYFAVGVYSKGNNGITAFADSWKNICCTFYHELTEARTDPDVEEVNRGGGQSLLGWYNSTDGEIGDIPMDEAGANLSLVMVEVKLANGTTAPIQLMYSNAVHGPEGPK